MERPGSSIISALGAGSGVDFIRLADDLANAGFAFQRETVESRIATLEARISAAAVLRGSVSSLASALGDRIRSGDLAPRARLGNPAVATVALPPGSVPRGTYSLEVTRLAQGQTLVSRSYADAAAPVGEGTLRIRFGTVGGTGFTADADRPALEIAVAADDTLQTLAAKISAAGGGALGAYVATGPEGAQLVLKGGEGAANGFVVEGQSSAAVPAAEPGDLSYLSWTPVNDAGELRAAANDAAFLLDTVPRTSPTNVVSALPEGFGLTLTATNTGAPTSLSFGTEQPAFAAVMGDLVAALNDVVAQLADVASPRGGELGSDAGARELRRDLARLTNQVIMPDAGPGEPRTLADLGLSLNRDGSFRLDTDRLAAALAASPEGVAAMFTTGPFGLFATIDDLARATANRSDPGSLGGSALRYEAQLKRGEERLARIAEQQESLRERLTRELAVAERRVSGSQSTLAFLRQQVDLWNGSN